MSVRPIFVDCFRNGRLLVSYEFGEPVGLIPGKPASDESLRDEAKSNLTSDRIALPPYDGFTFNIRRT